MTAAYDRKQAALAAHRSQFAREDGRVPTPINDPAFLQGIRARDAGLGALVDAGYGEALFAPEPLYLPHPGPFCLSPCY